MKTDEQGSSPESGNPTRFVILGGYLGAGKTTLAAALAKQLRGGRGKSVAIITNDQGTVLVDTEFMKDSGFDVRDVMGGCFCSNFSTFVREARTLVQASRPDVILAEPIGTSTNLLASVVLPLRTMYPGEFEVAPLMVVVDGTSLTRTMAPSASLMGRKIPAHQLQEAEYGLISKADLMSDQDIQACTDAVKREAPRAEVIPYSSVTKLNVDLICDVIDSRKTSVKAPLGVEQSVFSVEKASLGWFNANAVIRSHGRLDVYAFCRAVADRVVDAFDTESIAHVKIMVSSPKAAAKMSLVRGSLQVDGLRGGRYFEGEGKVVLNARVSASPGELKKVLSEAVRSSAGELGATIEKMEEICFSPRPEAPSHFRKGEKPDAGEKSIDSSGGIWNRLICRYPLRSEHASRLARTQDPP